VGLVGFEPTTKGFTSPRRFRREWTISSPAHRERIRVREGAGCSKPVIKGPCACPAAAQPPGSLCTFHRCTGGSAQDCHERLAAPAGSPEFIPSTSRVSA